jgi:hypothetical protein
VKSCADPQAQLRTPSDYREYRKQSRSASPLHSTDFFQINSLLLAAVFFSSVYEPVEASHHALALLA